MFKNITVYKDAQDPDDFAFFGEDATFYNFKVTAAGMLVIERKIGDHFIITHCYKEWASVEGLPRDDIEEVLENLPPPENAAEEKSDG